MEEFCVPRDDARDIVFRGELVAEAHNMRERTGRWWELALYRTATGKWVCSKTGCTQWQGERSTHSALVTDDLEQVFAFFGASPVAKALYANANLEFVERVD